MARGEALTQRARVERVNALVRQPCNPPIPLCISLHSLWQVLFHLLLIGHDGDLYPADNTAEFFFHLVVKDISEVLEA